jgi:hypothetical protein
VRRGLEGAAWFSSVRRGSEGCGVAQKGAAWISRVRRGSAVYGVAQLVARQETRAELSECYE